MGNFGEGRDFFYGLVKICRGVIFTIQTFFKAKNNIPQILNINKTKISVTCVYKQYEVKVKMVQEQRIQLKMKFLPGYNIRIVI